MRKKIFVALLTGATLFVPATVSADESNWFGESETTITTSYIWRGMKLSGPAIQPDINFGYADDDFEVAVDLWANASLDPANDMIKGRTTCNEFDISLYGTYKGLTLTVSDYNYSFSNYFESSYLDFHELDVQLDYYIGDKFPMTISWSSLLHSDELGDAAFAHYFQVAYDLTLGDFEWWFEVGGVPTESWYYGTDGFAITNLTAGLGSIQFTYNPAWKDWFFGCSITF